MPFKIKPSRLLSVPDTVDPNIVRVFDNFTWGDAGVDSIGPYFRVQEGSNAQTSISQGGEVNGEVVLLTGDGAAGTMAVNGVLIYGDRAFQASWVCYRFFLSYQKSRHPPDHHLVVLQKEPMYSQNPVYKHRIWDHLADKRILDLYDLLIFSFLPTNVHDYSWHRKGNAFICSH